MGYYHNPSDVTIGPQGDIVHVNVRGDGNIDVPSKMKVQQSFRLDTNTSRIYALHISECWDNRRESVQMHYELVHSSLLLIVWLDLYMALAISMPSPDTPRKPTPSLGIHGVMFPWVGRFVLLLPSTTTCTYLHRLDMMRFTNFYHMRRISHVPGGLATMVCICTYYGVWHVYRSSGGSMEGPRRASLYD